MININKKAEKIADNIIKFYSRKYPESDLQENYTTYNGDIVLKFYNIPDKMKEELTQKYKDQIQFATSQCEYDPQRELGVILIKNQIREKDLKGVKIYSYDELANSENFSYKLDQYIDYAREINEFAKNEILLLPKNFNKEKGYYNFGIYKETNKKTPYIIVPKFFINGTELQVLYADKEKIKEKLLETLGVDVKDYDGHLDEYIDECTDKNGEDWLWYLDCDNYEGVIREKDEKMIIVENEEESKEIAKMFGIDDFEEGRKTSAENEDEEER